MIYAISRENATKEHLIGPEEITEAPRASTPGELFRMLQGTLGRCTSKVYVDTEDEDAVPVGWVFEQRREYTDCEETYLHRSWVTVLERIEDGDRRKRID